MERNLDNVRGALEWAVETAQIDKGLRLGLAMRGLFFVRAGQKEALARLSALVEHHAAPRNTSIEAQAYNYIAELYQRQGEVDKAIALLERVEAMVDMPDVLTRRAQILEIQGVYAENQGDFVRADPVS